MALIRQGPGQLVGTALGGGEDDRLGQFAVGQMMGQQAMLMADVIRLVNTLADGGVTLVIRRQLHPLRVSQQLLGDRQDLAFQGGGKQQGLTAGRRRRGDELDGIDKAHIQHAIGLVQHQHFQAGEIHAAPLHMIHQAPGGRHQQIQRLLQQTHLRRIRHAAHHAAVGDLAVAAELADIVVDLHGQFPGRGQYQHPRPVAAHRRRGGQALQGRQDEGGGLTRARLGRGHQIATRQDQGNGLALYGGGLAVTGGFDGLQQIGIQI